MASRVRRGRSFTLVEVMLAVGIVGIAVSSCFQVFHLVRKMNVRARFYAQCLGYARQRLAGVVASHQHVGPVPVKSDIPGDLPVTATLSGEVQDAAGLPTLERVTLQFEYQEGDGTPHKLTMATYVTTVIQDSAGE